jgi:hypothetical protein
MEYILIGQYIATVILIYFLKQNNDWIKFFLFFSIGFVLVVGYYYYTVRGYCELIYHLKDNDRYYYLNGQMITDERYAVTKTQFSDIIYESSFHTTSFGKDDYVIRPHWTTETKHRREKNKRIVYKFADDLRIGDQFMSEDEWSFENVLLNDINWDRGPLENVTNSQVKEVNWYLYPKKNLQILAKLEFDFYKIEVITNCEVPLIVYLTNWKERHEMVSKVLQVALVVALVLVNI